MTTIEQAFTPKAVSYFYPIKWEKNKHKDAETLIVHMFNHTAKYYNKKASPTVEQELKKRVHNGLLDEKAVEKLFKQLLKVK
mgnify:FL=1|jgi:hypothetical protein